MDTEKAIELINQDIEYHISEVNKKYGFPEYVKNQNEIVIALTRGRDALREKEEHKNLQPLTLAQLSAMNTKNVEFIIIKKEGKSVKALGAGFSLGYFQYVTSIERLGILKAESYGKAWLAYAYK